jgi:hypothetical protein
MKINSSNVIKYGTAEHVLLILKEEFEADLTLKLLSYFVDMTDTGLAFNTREGKTIGIVRQSGVVRAVRSLPDGIRAAVYYRESGRLYSKLLRNRQSVKMRSCEDTVHNGHPNED